MECVPHGLEVPCEEVWVGPRFFDLFFRDEFESASPLELIDEGDFDGRTLSGLGLKLNQGDSFALEVGQAGSGPFGATCTAAGTDA
jgi:hypothetical protein